MFDLSLRFEEPDSGTAAVLKIPSAEFFDEQSTDFSNVESSMGGTGFLIQKGLKFEGFHVLLSTPLVAGSELVTILESNQGGSAAASQGYIKLEFATLPGRGVPDPTA